MPVTQATRNGALEYALRPRRVMEALSWMLKGICRSGEYPISMWDTHPDSDTRSRDPQTILGNARAKRICMSCDVRTECLSYAMRHNEPAGIWGGTSPRDRKRIRAFARQRMSKAG